jgi:hypothetical protein
MKYLYIPLVLFIFGCDADQNLGKQPDEGAVQSSPHVSKSPPAQASKLVDWTADGCSLDPFEPGFPLNRTQASLYESFGAPKDTDDFEFEKGLVYREREVLLGALSLPADAKRMVRELIWEKSGCTLTLWLVEKQGTWTSIYGWEDEPGSEM